jgi:hypothetical protein
MIDYVDGDLLLAIIAHAILAPRSRTGQEEYHIVTTGTISFISRRKIVVGKVIA